MAQSVLVPVDGSGPAENALEHALSAYPDATIVALHVLDVARYSGYGGEVGLAFSGDNLIEHRQREQASSILEAATELAETEGRTLETETREGHPEAVIVRYAAEEDIDHTVIGSHGRTGVKRLLLGSVAETVVRRSPVPVTVVREGCH